MDNTKKKEIINTLNEIVKERAKIKHVNGFTDAILNNKNYKKYSEATTKTKDNAKALKEINDWIKCLDKGLEVITTNTYTIINK